MATGEPRVAAAAPLIAIHEREARRVALTLVRTALTAAEAWRRAHPPKRRADADDDEPIGDGEADSARAWIRRAVARSYIATLGVSAAVRAALEAQAQRIVGVAGDSGIRQLVGLGARINVLRERGVVQAIEGGDTIRGIRLADTPERLATIQTWVTDGVDLISTYPREALDGIEAMIAEHVRGGHRWETLTRALEERVGMSTRHAALVARDQIGKLNAAVTQDLQRQAGITRYRWRTSRDQRVRERHRELEGTIWEAAGLGAPLAGPYGQHAHPGEGIQCRCYREPIVDDVPGLARPGRGIETVPEQAKVAPRPSLPGTVPRAIVEPGGRPQWALGR